jgi:hypothetical protein
VGFSADIAEGIESGEAEWTLHWIVQDGLGRGRLAWLQCEGAGRRSLIGHDWRMGLLMERTFWK